MKDKSKDGWKWKQLEIKQLKQVLNPRKGQKFKAVVLLWYLLDGKTFIVSGEKFKLGGDLLDLGLVDKADPSRLVMLEMQFKEFLRVAGQLSDEDFGELLKEMTAHLSTLIGD